MTTPQGMAGLLARLKISYQRGRDYVHSPDPHYQEKLAYIAAILAQTRACTKRLVAVYLDELTYYRQPTVAPAYSAHGDPPRASRSYRANTATRVVATLDDADGRVCAWQGSKVGIAQLVRFFQQLRTAYPEAERLYLFLDNWPVHFHPEVLVALEPQESPFPRYLPPDWQKEPSRAARQKWGDLQLPLQLVPLPTYASWENPIEKLWRWAKQDVLHLHRLADQLTQLRQEMWDFLAQFAAGSPELLRYVGLTSTKLIS